jgi:hypothetical protein
VYHHAGFTFHGKVPPTRTSAICFRAVILFSFCLLKAYSLYPPMLFSLKGSGLLENKSQRELLLLSCHKLKKAQRKQVAKTIAQNILIPY